MICFILVHSEFVRTFLVRTALFPSKSLCERALFWCWYLRAQSASEHVFPPFFDRYLLIQNDFLLMTLNRARALKMRFRVRRQDGTFPAYKCRVSVPSSRSGPNTLMATAVVWKAETQMSQRTSPYHRFSLREKSWRANKRLLRGFTHFQFHCVPP